MAPSASPAPASDAELQRLMTRVARARQLERRQPPALVAVSRDELVDRALRHAEAQAGPGALDAETRLLGALELLPADFTWQAVLRRAFEASLSAFYDAERAEVVIDAALSGDERQRVLAHELAHALVDRHFGLAARLADVRQSADARDALHLLAEGDADGVVSQLWPDTPSPAPAEDTGPELATHGLPPVMQRSLVAAYADGTRVVSRMRAAGGWAAIDAAYRDPPRGTRALLAPERGALPRPPAAWSPEPGASLTASEVLGEQTLRIVLEEWLPAPLAAEMADDWEGDRLSVLAGAGFERAVVWELRWRTGRGEQASSALRRALRFDRDGASHRTLSCRPHRDAGALGLWSHGDRLWLAHLTGVPLRSACERLERWSHADESRSFGGGDPGPRHLIGPP